MPDTDSTPEDQSPSQGIQSLKDEAARAVSDGIESDFFEQKREFDLTELEPKLRFVKTIQGIANNHRNQRTLFIIGGDTRAKRFQAVANTEAFDPARITALLSRYLTPEPIVSVYNNLTSSDGEPFVVIDIPPVQPRPIVCKSGSSAGEEALQEGAILIKRGTRLVHANREDLDAMYRDRSEEWAERRARSRFSDLREELLAEVRTNPSPSIFSKSILALPLEAQRARLKDWLGEARPLSMNVLFEEARDVLLSAIQNPMQAVSVDGTTEATRDEGQEPVLALNLLLEVALLAIKFSTREQVVRQACDLVQEVFEAAGQQRTAGYDSSPYFDENCGSNALVVQAWAAIRVIAIYALSRRRYDYIPAIQKDRFVPRIYEQRNDVGTLSPLAFFPLIVNSRRNCLADGIIELIWNLKGKNFLSYFHSKDIFLRSALELEFTLEFNSYLAISTKIKDVLAQTNSELQVNYFPDIWRYRPSEVKPFLQYLLDSILGPLGGKPSSLLIGEAWVQGMNYISEPRVDLFRKFLKSTFEDADRARNQQRMFWPYHASDGFLDFLEGRTDRI